MTNIDAVVYALLGGILPALIWLAFWLHEDYKHPEPRGLIIKTFLLGMLSVFLVIPFQKAIHFLLPEVALASIVLWVVVEEIFKFGAAFIGGLSSAEDNEPIDPIIYMITAALGFAAVENALFILGPIIGDDVIRSLITGNLRFVGASLVHVVSSGIIGVALAFSFYKRIDIRVISALVAIILAIILHAVFNLAIIYGGNFGAIGAFSMVWALVVVLLLAFERSKAIAR